MSLDLRWHACARQTLRGGQAHPIKVWCVHSYLVSQMGLGTYASDITGDWQGSLQVSQGI